MFSINFQPLKGTKNQEPRDKTKKSLFVYGFFSIN